MPYTSTGILLAAIKNWEDISRNIVGVKTVIDVDGAREKLSSSQLPAVVHFISNFGQEPTSGGRNGTHTITLNIKSIIVVEERVQKKLARNVLATVELLDAYLNAIRRSENDGFTKISVKPTARGGGPIGIVSYAGVDYNGTIIDAEISIYPDDEGDS